MHQSMYAHDNHYLTCSNFNSLLTEMITPQAYIYKTASCLLCIRGSLRLAPNNIDELQVLGVKQCYVYTSTRDGGLYVYGHEKFVSVFTNITWRLQQACPAMMSEKLTYSLNYHAHYNLVRDLGIDWNGPHPDWWPCHVWFHSKGQLTYF